MTRCRSQKNAAASQRMLAAWRSEMWPSMNCPCFPEDVSAWTSSLQKLPRVNTSAAEEKAPPACDFEGSTRPILRRNQGSFLRIPMRGAQSQLRSSLTWGGSGHGACPGLCTRLPTEGRGTHCLATSGLARLPTGPWFPRMEHACSD